MTHANEPNDLDEPTANATEAAGDVSAEAPAGSSEADAPVGDERSDPPRSTPLSVREVMGEATTDRKETAPGADESEPETRERVVEDEDGGTWWARVAGATRSGWPTDAGAPLLLVVFSPDGPEGEPEREAFAVGSSLESVPDEELAELLAERSRPYRAPEGSTGRPPQERDRRKRGGGR
jgi:hypothetical protein